MFKMIRGISDSIMNRARISPFITSTIVIALLLFSHIIYVSQAQYSHYCNLISCKGKPHSMCIYGSSPHARCGHCYQVGLTAAEKDEVLKHHNNLRKSIALGQENRGQPGPQPAAAPGAMKLMTWSSELEMTAQRWANQCLRKHDSCRNTPSMRIGQNAAYESNTVPEEISPKVMVQRWYDEVDLFNKNGISSFQGGGGTGHFTQLVWGNSNKLGCGYVKCDLGNRLHKGQLICNYGPAGNFIGEPVYRT